MIGSRSLVFLAFAGASAVSSVAKPDDSDGVSITFLANEGVLLSASDSSGTRKVLIDALFEPYGSYAAPADTTRVALRQARAPYDAVDLVLVTHHHGDHFHPAPAADHLHANPRAVLITSQQVIDSLRGRVKPELLRDRRVVARITPPGSSRSLLINGIPVQLVGLPHGGRRHRHVEHLAYVVELGGRRILHVGDGELSEATLKPLRIDTMRIDIALLPFWALTDVETRKAVDRWIRPRRIAAIHLAENDLRTAGEVRAAAPDARVFLRSLESAVW